MVQIISNGELKNVSQSEYEALVGKPVTVEDVSWMKVSPVQARLALIQAGLLSQVDTLVSSSPQEVKTWYEYATSWERDHKFVKTFATQLQLTDKQVDDLFKTAKGL